MSRRMSRFHIGFAVLLVLGGIASGQAAVVGLELMSNNQSFTGSGAGDSLGPAISADGRKVAFSSTAPDLVLGDTNGNDDVFVRDVGAGNTILASVSSAGIQGNLESRRPAINADGRIVAFQSEASNLVPSDTNGTDDVFVRDLALGTTRRISVSDAGVQGNGPSQHPSISADGRFVAFQSAATNLVMNDTNGVTDVFVHDVLLGRTQLVSVSSAGTQGSGDSFDPSISGDGMLVAFGSFATTLIGGDGNNSPDIFVRDRNTAQTTLISREPMGLPGNSGSFSPSISSDGRFVGFDSDASNLVPGDGNGAADVFLFDRNGQRMILASAGSGGVTANGSSFRPRVSADGRFVAFESEADDLSPVGDFNLQPDIYVFDRNSQTADRASISPFGTEPTGPIGSFSAAIDAGGGKVVFESDAVNLTPRFDTFFDIFLTHRLPGQKNLPPVADAGPGLQGTVMHDGDPATSTATVVLDGSRSFDPEGGPLFYQWYQGDGVQPISGDPMVPQTLGPGMTSRVLEVTDLFGSKSRSRVDISIQPEPNLPPRANPGPDQLVQAPHGGAVAQVTLSADRSSDPEGDPITYSWRDADGTEIGTGSPLMFGLPPGKHTYILRATDNYGAYSESRVSVRVQPAKNRAPVADAGDDQSVADSGADITPILLDGSGSFDPDGDPLTYTWSLNHLDIATGVSPSVDLEPGRHSILLTTLDALGGIATDTVVVTVGVVDVTSLVRVRKMRPTPGKRRGEYNIRVRVTNLTDASLPGPVSLTLDALTSTKMLNETGITTTATKIAGKPYLDGGAIGPGATVQYTVRAKLTGVNPVLPNPVRLLCGLGPR